MAAGDLIRIGTLWQRNCASALDALESSSVAGAWTTWSPTYGGGGSQTFGTVTTHYAKYIQIGKRVHFSISATGTTGGSTDPNVSFTLPVTAASSDALNFSAWYVDGGNPLPGSARGATTTKIYVAKLDYANWGTGSNRRISCSGCYEAA